MIYTPHETVNCRNARKRLNPRPAGENAAGGNLSICVKLGAKRAPIGHKTPRFGAAAEGPSRRQTLVFSENFAPQRRFAVSRGAAI